jgi:hypothetical protein
MREKYTACGRRCHNTACGKKCHDTAYERKRGNTHVNISRDIRGENNNTAERQKKKRKTPRVKGESDNAQLSDAEKCQHTVYMKESAGGGSTC